MHSVGQDPGAIYYIRLRHVQSADWEDSVPWPYLMKPGPHAAERFLQGCTVKIDRDMNGDMSREFSHAVTALALKMQ